jgi:hypothetical protein
MNKKYLILLTIECLLIIWICFFYFEKKSKIAKTSTEPMRSVPIGQQEVRYLDFCKMLALDQSNVDFDKRDTVEMRIVNGRRELIFEQNFIAFIDYVKKNGFPKPNLVGHIESCRQQAITLMFIHYSQVYPDRFFSNEVKDLFARELEKDGSYRDFLNQSFKMCFMTNDICLHLKSNVLNCLKVWRLDDELKKMIDYQDCKMTTSLSKKIMKFSK